MLRSGQEDGSSAFWSSLGKNVDIHKHSWPEKPLDGDETPKSWLVTMQNARRNTHTKTGTTAGTTDTYYHKQHDERWTRYPPATVLRFPGTFAKPLEAKTNGVAIVLAWIQCAIACKIDI